MSKLCRQFGLRVVESVSGRKDSRSADRDPIVVTPEVVEKRVVQAIVMGGVARLLVLLQQEGLHFAGRAGKAVENLCIVRASTRAGS